MGDGDVPYGLDMSLDDLIKAKSEKDGGRGRPGGRGGRAGPNNFGVRNGGVQKVSSPVPKTVAAPANGRAGGQLSQQQGSAAQRGRGRAGQQSGGGRGRGRSGDADGWSGGGQQQQQQQHQHQHRQQPRFQPRARKPALPVKTTYRQATGEVAVQLADTEIVTVGADGSIMLNTGGFATYSTFTVMNAAVNAVGIFIRATGPVDAGEWQVSSGTNLRRFFDGMKIPSMGMMHANRGLQVMGALQGVASVDDADNLVAQMGATAAAGALPVSDLGMQAAMQPNAATLAAMQRARMAGTMASGTQFGATGGYGGAAAGYGAAAGGYGGVGAAPAAAIVPTVAAANPLASQAATAFQMAAAANPALLAQLMSMYAGAGAGGGTNPYAAVASQAGGVGGAGRGGEALGGYGAREMEVEEPEVLRRLRAQGRLQGA